MKFVPFGTAIGKLYGNSGGSMMTKQEDRRVQRTRQLLEHALIELTVEKGYDKVTVQDIVDRANVGRTTFYAHYQDKEELLNQSLAGFMDSLLQELEQKSDQSNLLPVLTVFRHVAEIAPFYLAFNAIPVLHEKSHQQLVILTKQRLKTLETAGQAVNMPHDLLANYFAGALLALLTWWLKAKTPYSAEEMAGMFQQMVTATLSSRAVKGKEKGGVVGHPPIGDGGG